MNAALNRKISETSRNGIIREKSNNVLTTKELSNADMPKLKSFLFENQFFYLDKNLKNGYDYTIKVIENSGNVIKSLNDVKNQKIWLVIPDNYPKKKMDELKEFKIDAKPVSYRWIDYCIQKKYLVKEIEKNRLVNLLPFPCNVPI